MSRAADEEHQYFFYFFLKNENCVRWKTTTAKLFGTDKEASRMNCQTVEIMCTP